MSPKLRTFTVHIVLLFVGFSLYGQMPATNGGPPPPPPPTTPPPPPGLSIDGGVWLLVTLALGLVLYKCWKRKGAV